MRTRAGGDYDEERAQTRRQLINLVEMRTRAGGDYDCEEAMKVRSMMVEMRTRAGGDYDDSRTV